MSVIKKVSFVINFVFVILLIGCLPESTINRSPVISVDFTYTVEVGDLTFNLEELISIVDDNDGNIPVTSSMISYNDFSVFVIGSYDVEIIVKDSDNLQAEASVIINVVDTTKPVVTLVGAEEITLTLGDTYSEPGATCTDNYDENCEVVIDDSALDLTTSGSYTITYSASDSSLNEADVVIRTIVVEIVAEPVISLLGPSIIDVEVGDDYIEEGATCKDSIGNDCTVVIDSSGVDTSLLGTYTVTYNASDEFGNDAVEVSRTIQVVDTTNPVITVIGDLTIYLEVGDSYTELGVSCTDNYDSCDVITTSGDFDPNVLGTYIIKYNAVDTSNNNASEVTRTIIVEDNIAPEITLRGDDTLYIDLGSEYIDLGANCIDNYDIVCEVIVDTSTLDLYTLGTYTITYNTSDASGNNADELTRTVTVQDPSERDIGLLGDEVYYILKDSTWGGAGVFVPFDGEYSASVVGSIDTSTVGVYRFLYKINDELNHYSYFERIVNVVEELPEIQNQVSLINMYNHNIDLYLIMVGYDINNDLFLDNVELNGVTDLDLSGLNINHVYFIEYFDDLTSLNLNNNNLYDIDFVVDLPKLNTLLISNNNIGSSDLFDTCES